MAVSRIEGTGKLKDTYRRIIDRVAEASVRSGRGPADVAMVAVTKDASPDIVRSIVDMGQKDLGESRVQQLGQRVAALEEYLSRKRTLGGALAHTGPTDPEVRWHMIGHLQRNKVKKVVPHVMLIHSVDSLRVAEELQATAAGLDRVVDVLIQANVSGEASKQGVAPAAVGHLAEQINTMVHLRLRGIMTMAPRGESPEDSRPTFARAAELFHETRTDGCGGSHFKILSMGMSDDFEVAIEEGANVVRIGRALFGDSAQA